MNMIFFVLAPKRGRAPCKHSKHIQKHIPLPLLRNYRGPRFGNQMLELIVVRESLLPEKFSYTNVKTNCCRRTIRRCWNQVLSEKFWYASVETNCQRLPNPDTPMLRPIVVRELLMHKCWDQLLCRAYFLLFDKYTCVKHVCCHLLQFVVHALRQVSDNLHYHNVSTSRPSSSTSCSFHVQCNVFGVRCTPCIVNEHYASWLICQSISCQPTEYWSIKCSFLA